MRIFPIAILLFIFTAFAAATVNVSSPTSGSTDSSPVHVTSTSSSSHAITRTIIYVDNKSAYSVASGSVNTSLTMASGSHSIVVQSWDSAGTVIKSSSIKITVNSSSGSAPSGSKQYANINQMTGWDSCDACAGAGGSGPKATHTLTQNISSPALDGKAAEFYLKGSKPYSNALWWKQLGANPNVSNFTYDLYFYLKTPSAAQALEFDVNQSLNGKKYIFGTECDINDHHVWNIYDAGNHKWMETSVACTAPVPYSWNHLTLEFQRVNSQMKFISITLNGKKSYFNKTYNPASSSSKELNVAVQIDGNGQNVAYSEWADKINLTTW